MRSSAAPVTSCAQTPSLHRLQHRAPESANDGIRHGRSLASLHLVCDWSSWNSWPFTSQLVVSARGNHRHAVWKFLGEGWARWKLCLHHSSVFHADQHDHRGLWECVGEHEWREGVCCDCYADRRWVWVWVHWFIFIFMFYFTITPLVLWLLYPMCKKIDSSVIATTVSSEGIHQELAFEWPHSCDSFGNESFDFSQSSEVKDTLAFVPCSSNARRHIWERRRHYTEVIRQPSTIPLESQWDQTVHPGPSYR